MLNNWHQVEKFIQKRTLLVLLIAGLLNGLVLVFLVPPWMHYDEPGHFEYAWLIANRPGWPQKGDYDQEMRRAVGNSINAHNFQQYTGVVIDTTVEDEPINIITPQAGREPLYYALAAVPLWILRGAEITTQLYAARFVSLGLFLLLIVVVFKTCQVLFALTNPMCWLVPLFALTLPSFADVMTGVNSDAAAVVALSLFIWVSVVLIKRGITLVRLVALAGTLILCYFSKSTAWLAFPLSLLTFVFALFRQKRSQKYVWMGFGALLILGVSLLFSWENSAPAFYYGRNISANPARIKTDTAPLGEAVIAQEGQSQGYFEFYQLLSQTSQIALAGRTVTLGGWVWADAPTSLAFPRIRNGQSHENIVFSDQAIDLTEKPQFFSFSSTLPDDFGGVSWIVFRPSLDVDNRVYWDGLVLVEGDFAGTQPPEFDNPAGYAGTWKGERFSNQLRNASGESAWPLFSSWIYEIAFSRYNFSTPRLLSIFDKAIAWYYRLTAKTLFKTFWAVFGWGAVFLIGPKPYHILAVINLIYLIGFVLGLIRRKAGLSWQALFLFAATAVLQILMTLFRGAGSWFSRTYIPTGRYIYPAIIPIGVLLMSGADSLVRIVHEKSSLSLRILYGGVIFLLAAIMIWAWVSMGLFYYVK